MSDFYYVAEYLGHYIRRRAKHAEVITFAELPDIPMFCLCLGGLYTIYAADSGLPLNRSSVTPDGAIHEMREKLRSIDLEYARKVIADHVEMASHFPIEVNS